MPHIVDSETRRYLNRLRIVPALSREDEVDLARAFLERGDLAAGERVIAANLRHVLPIALRYRRLGVALDELIAQGNLALCTALRRFDPARGVRFGTYASYWVRAEMLGLVLQQRSLVGGGRGPLRGRFVFKMRREHAELLARLGDDPEVLRILAERFGKRPEQVAELLQRIEQRDASLDASGPGDVERPLVDRIRSEGDDPETEAAAHQLATGDLARAIARATAELDPRERYIVEHRLIADEEARMPLSAIGRSFGVSRERARQIEQAVRAKLKARLRKLTREVAADFLPAV
jgi:RNA polymerase sigma-32 factor